MPGLGEGSRKEGCEQDAAGAQPFRARQDREEHERQGRPSGLAQRKPKEMPRQDAGCYTEGRRNKRIPQVQWWAARAGILRESILGRAGPCLAQ